MTYANAKNQVTNSNSGIKTVYCYRYFTTDGNGTCNLPHFNASQHNVIAENKNLIVLDDANFTRVSIDKDYHHGCNQIDIPLMYLYSDDDCFGNGFNFSLSSSKELTAEQVQEIIEDMHNEKISKLVSLDYEPINQQMIKDALTLNKAA